MKTSNPHTFFYLFKKKITDQPHCSWMNSQLVIGWVNLTRLLDLTENMANPRNVFIH